MRLASSKFPFGSLRFGLSGILAFLMILSLSWGRLDGLSDEAMKSNRGLDGYTQVTAYKSCEQWNGITRDNTFDSCGAAGDMKLSGGRNVYECSLIANAYVISQTTTYNPPGVQYYESQNCGDKMQARCVDLQLTDEVNTGTSCNPAPRYTTQYGPGQ